ncbi:MAG TPA: hypothetical protein VGL62_06965 [Vicinamibacterales bacterium]|jgi:hypothetical protein
MGRIAAFALAILLTGSASTAWAVTVHDVIELSRAGLSDDILVTLIGVDRTVFSIDAATLEELKQAGVSDTVVKAMIRSGRTPATSMPEPVTAQFEPPQPAIDSSAPAEAEPAPIPIYVPVPVPVAVPVVAPEARRTIEFVRTRVRTTDGGKLDANLPLPPNCTVAKPVYWGFGGMLRPNSWQPPATVVCR